MHTPLSALVTFSLYFVPKYVEPFDTLLSHFACLLSPPGDQASGFCSPSQEPEKCIWYVKAIGKYLQTD